VRVVLDTDVIVAGLRSRRGASREWLRATLRQEVEVVLSVPLLLQYQAVLQRPATLAAVRLEATQIGRFLDGLCNVGRLVEISFLWRPMLRDPDDDMVLEAALNGQADRLLTFNLRDFVGSDRVGVTVQSPGPAWRAWKGRTA
jgi:putative PIN family toxin of toxin-antitoxin system